MKDKFDELTKGLTRSVTRHCMCGYCAAVVVASAVGFSVAALEFSPWSTPINLGPSINTSSNELRPSGN